MRRWCSPPLNADLAHRAFSNLFVTTEVSADRPGDPLHAPEAEAGRSGAVDVPSPGPTGAARRFDLLRDRPRAIHRPWAIVVENPAAMDAACRELSGIAGTVLDPIVAIRRVATIAPDESATVHVVSGAAGSREEALALIAKYCDHHFVQRALRHGIGSKPGRLAPARRDGSRRAGLTSAWPRP